MPAWNIKPGAGGVQQVDMLQVGQGSNLFGVTAGTVTVDLPSITNALTVEQSITITGVRAGDAVFILGPDAGLNAGLIITQAYVSGNDTVKCRVGNMTAAPIDAGSATFRYLWLDFTE